MTLLALTLVAVAGLLVQSLLALRSHAEMVDATLGDYAAFAAERIATELDQTFSGLFLDQIALTREAHYAHLAAPDRPSRRPDGPGGQSEPRVPLFFSLDRERLVVHGTPSDTAAIDGVVEAIARHLPAYPRPAPYVVLRGQESRAVVYRKEEYYGAVHVYGFVVRLDAFDSWLARIVETTPLLPRSLGDDTSTSDLLSVGIHLSPSTPPLLLRPGAEEIDGPTAWAFAAKAARLAVGVRIDADRAETLVAGGAPGGGLPLFGVLALLTVGLLTTAVRLQRRHVRFAESREAFIANVSHDLRTPITQIRMFSETLLLARLPTEEDRRRSLEVIRRQTESLGDLVDNILHASGSRPPLEAIPSDLHRLARDTVDAMRASGAEIVLTLEGEEEAVVDPIACTRILTNLLDNAVRHGSGEAPIEVVVEHDREAVRFTVDDAGPGIAPSHRDRVFDRFERLGGGPGKTGAGIGLAVVRDLARRHGGDADIGEAPGGGVRARAWIREGAP